MRIVRFLRVRFLFSVLFVLNAILLVTATAEVTVSVSTFAANGTLSNQPSHTTVSNYGNKPFILLNGNEDNSYDVAYHTNSSSTIQILNFDKDGVLVNRLQPDSIVDAKGLLGLAKVTDDGSFVVGYSKNSPHSGSIYEFWVTRIDGQGQKIFTTQIFGDVHKDTLGAKGEPGTFSSGRLVYNKSTQKIGIYVGHTMRWEDGIRHQGGFLAFMSLDASFVVADGWYFSHNFDQRIMVIGSDYYTLAHGDAYPRALGFAKWTDGGVKGTKVFDKNFLMIPGAIGANKTSAQLGNVIPLSDGTFGVTFTSANGRNNFDVAYRQLSATGDTLNIQWLTSHPSSTLAIYPKIAKYGSNTILLWEEVEGTVHNGVKYAILDNSGSVLTPATSLSDNGIRLTPYYDLITLPNGDILWANQKMNDSISVFKIDSPLRNAVEFKTRTNSMELSYASDNMVLNALEKGLYHIKQYSANGRSLSSRSLELEKGIHLFDIAAKGISYVEVHRGEEVTRLSVSTR